MDIKTKDAHAPEQSVNKIRAAVLLFFQTVVLAALFPIVLGRSGGDTLITLWRLWVLLCSYFYCAVCVLSATTRKGKARLFISVTYVGFFAFVVDAVLSRAAGAFIMYLNSVWIAGVFGHALAKHNASSEQVDPSSEKAREKLAGEVGVIAFLAIVLAACIMSPVWIMEPDCAPEAVLGFLPVLLCIALTIAIICALKPRPMPGPPAIVVALGVECDTEIVLFCSFLCPFMLYMLSLLLLGEVGGAVVLWICVLGLAVLLGYCFRLHASSACNSIDGWLSVRSKTKMVAEPEDEVKEKKAGACLQEEQADADGGNKEETVISSEST